MSKRSEATATSEYSYDKETQPEPEFNINRAAAEAVPEEMPDLEGLEQEPSQGAWPVGWYTAEVLEGFSFRSGKQVTTTDEPSKDGSSRNITLALAVTNANGETRNYRAGLNYRVDDLTPEVVQSIRDAKQEFAGLAMKDWPDSMKDLKRSTLALGKIGQVQKAFGFKFGKRDGVLNPLVFVGQKADIHLRLTEDGFNEVNEFAKLGDRTKKSGRRPTTKR